MGYAGAWDMLGAMRSWWFPVYRVVGSALAPVARRRLTRAAAGDPALVARQAERRGHVPNARDELWVHAASVGELNAAEPLIRRLVDRHGARIVISTMTHTAAARAGERFTGSARVRHVFAPLDTPACVGRWLDHTRPRRLLLVETEIWPVLLEACRRREIPVAMVNARVSRRALGRYRRFAGLFEDALSAVDPVLCQSDADLERLAALGVSRERLAVTGNLKFDLAAPERPSERVRAWTQSWGDRRVWIAGSTHAGEEAIVGRAHARVLEGRPDALVIVVPRHPERAGEARAELQRVGLETCAIDDLKEKPDAQAVVVDRMGVLAELYGCAAAVFVAGSLAPGIGGHNLMEAALAGRPVITGPHLDDQRDAARILSAAGVLDRAATDEALAEAVTRWLDEADEAERIGDQARRTAQAQRGAVAATIERLERWLRPVVADTG